MEIKKHIQSTTGPLEELLEKGENLDFRLDEPNWESLEVGDYIQYWEDFSGWDTEPRNDARRVNAQIIDIIHASDFEDLMEKCKQIDFDEESKNDTFAHLRKYWSEEAEQNTGALGLYVRKIGKPFYKTW